MSEDAHEIKLETIPASRQQVGGNHYKGFAIQPGEFSTKNKLSGMLPCVIKRICSYHSTGDREELEKAQHELALQLEWDESP